MACGLRVFSNRFPNKLVNADLNLPVFAGEVLPQRSMQHRRRGRCPRISSPPAELQLRQKKIATSIRLDAETLAWFQSLGKGYQSKINAVLRAYKASHEEATHR
jgi:uncharacterized protein (DUF4415 family)